MRKLFAIAIGAMFLLPALPAHAQTGAKASLSGVSGGQAVSGSVGLKGCGSAATGIKKVELRVDGRLLTDKQFDNIQTEGCTTYPWDTTRTPSGLSSNGRYTVSARAVANSGASDEVSVYVYVDNAPSIPSGFDVSSSGNTVNMSWAANPEPDITGYRVERDSGSGWSGIADTGSTSFSETIPEGSHSYRVIAFRQSPISGTRGSSASEVRVASYAAPPPETSDGTDTGSTGDTGDTGDYGDGYGNNTGGNGGYGGGAGVPGYSGGPSGKGGDRGAGPMGSTTGGLPSSYLSSGSRSLSGIGLPGGLTLPGSGGATVDGPAAITDDTFEETLPYELSGSDGTLVNDPGNPFRPAFINGMTIIPPDALRWVGAGLWLLVTALLLKFLERRVAANETTSVAQLPKIEESAA